MTNLRNDNYLHGTLPDTLSNLQALQNQNLYIYRNSQAYQCGSDYVDASVYTWFAALSFITGIVAV